MVALTQRFECVPCRQPSTLVDEDGCCRTCGADAIVVCVRCGATVDGEHACPAPVPVRPNLYCIAAHPDGGPVARVFGAIPVGGDAADPRLVASERAAGQLAAHVIRLGTRVARVERAVRGWWRDVHLAATMAAVGLDGEGTTDDV